MRLTASLIVRNEEAFLPGCLASVAGQVDEIVVVDTGSTDRSVAIAQEFGARVLHLPWRNDFAAARNAGLDAASGDWILYIDADERLTVPPGTTLAENLAAPEAFAARVLFRPQLNSTAYREYRLFRNDPRLRFRGAMHETILPDLEVLRRTVGAIVVDSPASLQHLGYEGDLTAKHRRNLPLLRAAIAVEPGRLYYWYHLAETLAALGEVEEALSVCTDGLILARQASTEGDRAIASTLATTEARLLHARGEDAMPAIERGLGFQPGQPNLLLLKARVLIDAGQPAAAVEILAALSAVDASSFIDPLIAYDRRTFACYAPDLLGVALLRLGRRAEAAEAFAQAAAGAPDDPSYAVKAAALRGTRPAMAVS